MTTFILLALLATRPGTVPTWSESGEHYPTLIECARAAERAITDTSVSIVENGISGTVTAWACVGSQR